MNTAEAVTRPDAWKAIPWKGKYRVGRELARDTFEWHRGRPRFGNRYNPGTPILFRFAEHAMARAGALNLADAEASQVASR
jgi:hypothetical protein